VNLPVRADVDTVGWTHAICIRQKPRQCRASPAGANLVGDAREILHEQAVGEVDAVRTGALLLRDDDRCDPHFACDQRPWNGEGAGHGHDRPLDLLPLKRRRTGGALALRNGLCIAPCRLHAVGDTAVAARFIAVGPRPTLGKDGHGPRLTRLLCRPVEAFKPIGVAWSWSYEPSRCPWCRRRNERVRHGAAVVRDGEREEARLDIRRRFPQVFATPEPLDHDLADGRVTVHAAVDPVQPCLARRELALADRMAWLPWRRRALVPRIDRVVSVGAHPLHPLGREELDRTPVVEDSCAQVCGDPRRCRFLAHRRPRSPAPAALPATQRPCSRGEAQEAQA
jgi:hypothetical protein